MVTAVPTVVTAGGGEVVELSTVNSVVFEVPT
jgi:hypothetical protein